MGTSRRGRVRPAARCGQAAAPAAPKPWRRRVRSSNRLGANRGAAKLVAPKELRMINSSLTRVCSLVFLTVAITSPALADPIKFARYPHVANGRIAFSYHGDIWIANQDGSGPM